VPGAEGALSSERALDAKEIARKRRIERMERKSRRTRQVALQSYLYAGSFFFNWVALTVRAYVLSVSFRNSPKQLILTYYLGTLLHLIGNTYYTASERETLYTNTYHCCVYRPLARLAELFSLSRSSVQEVPKGKVLDID